MIVIERNLSFKQTLADMHSLILKAMLYIENVFKKKKKAGQISV